MTTVEILKIVTGVIVSLGGGGVIVLGFSSYFGKLFASRYEAKVKATFQKEINEYQLQLDILKQSSIRYADKQFEYYGKVWASLYDLKILADDLWEEANLDRFERFSKQLKLTKSEIEKVSLFFEEKHYEELAKVIKGFSDYNFGKFDLINYRQGDYVDDYNINQMIVKNGQIKQSFEALLVNIRIDLKKQIRGGIK